MGKTILVTGFGPFMEHEKNASWEAVKELQEIGVELGEDYELVVREMPVLYKEVSEMVSRFWDDFKPVLVVHVGVHGDATEVVLEGSACNDDHTAPDNDGKRPATGCCVDGCCSDLHCKMDLDQLADRCAQNARSSDLSVSFKKSHDAGRYLCNYSYYCSLNLDRGPALFVHVPPLARPFTCTQLALALRVIVRSSLEVAGHELVAATAAIGASA